MGFKQGLAGLALLTLTGCGGYQIKVETSNGPQIMECYRNTSMLGEMESIAIGWVDPNTHSKYRVIDYVVRTDTETNNTANSLVMFAGQSSIPIQISQAEALRAAQQCNKWQFHPVKI